MAKLQKNSLRGDFAKPSIFFLEDHGFKNIESCSDKSVWAGRGIQLHIEPTDDVMDYPKLFGLIYDSGINYGKYMERKMLLNAATQFIQNYGIENKNIHY